MLLTESDVAFHSGEACTVWLKSRNVIMEAVNEGEHGPIYKDDIKTRLRAWEIKLLLQTC